MKNAVINRDSQTQIGRNVALVESNLRFKGLVG